MDKGRNAYIYPGYFKMKRIVTILVCMTYLQLNSQVLFSKTYTVPEDKTGLTNYFPNWLSALFPTDSLIYGFGYSADTNYIDVFGTAFYVFDWSGTLRNYYHIKDDSLHTFFYPEGIHTWDGIVFYTSFNNNYKDQSILKFNKLTGQQEILTIKNTVITGGDIVRGNMVSSNDGCLITASEIAIDSTGFNYKIQVSKIDTQGKIKWQKILGKNPGNSYQNHCFSSYVDQKGDILIGVGYSDSPSRGWPADYQSLLYKLNSDGENVNSANSVFGRTGFNQTYDIVEDNFKRIYLLSDYNYNESQYPYANRGYGIIQQLDSTMKYKKFVPLNLATTIDGNASDNSFDKIINSNDRNGFIVGGDIPYTDTIITFNNATQSYDSLIWKHDILHLIKLDSALNLVWKKAYRIRNGKDDGYLYDLKSCPSGGYIVAAASYLDDAKEKFGDPYYMPWLLRVDDDGCLIPGCGVVNIKNNTDANDLLELYPNPCSDYIIISNRALEKCRYSIISSEGKIIDEFSTLVIGEEIVIPIYNYKPGYYIVIANGQMKSSSVSFIKK